MERDNQEIISVVFDDKSGKYAIGGYSGSMMTRPIYTLEQVEILFNYLNNGLTMDMFKRLSLQDYKTFVKMSYNSLKIDHSDKKMDLAREEMQEIAKLDAWHKAMKVFEEEVQKLGNVKEKGQE